MMSQANASIGGFGFRLLLRRPQDFLEQPCLVLDWLCHGVDAMPW